MAAGACAAAAAAHPPPGEHNLFRGAPLATYEGEALDAIHAPRARRDIERALADYTREV